MLSAFIVILSVVLLSVLASSKTPSSIVDEKLSSVGLYPRPNIVNFVQSYFTSVDNKLECFNLRLIFASKARAYPCKAPLGDPFLGIHTNIRVGRKSLPRTNTQAYYEHL